MNSKVTLGIRILLGLDDTNGIIIIIVYALTFYASDSDWL